MCIGWSDQQAHHALALRLRHRQGVFLSDAAERRHGVGAAAVVMISGFSAAAIHSADVRRRRGISVGQGEDVAWLRP